MPGEQESYNFPDIQASRVDLEKSAEDFLLAIDEIMREGELSKDGELSRHHYVALVARGAALRACFDDDEFIVQLENAARCSDTISISTDMLWFPWEAIYFGDLANGAFLGHMVSVVRRPFSADLKARKKGHRSSRELPVVQKAAPQVILVDAVLESNSTNGKTDNQVSLRGMLEYRTSGHGTKILICDKDLSFLDAARESLVVQWICEHDTEGLRLCEGAHFTEEICRVASLGSGLLVLAGCETGGGRNRAEGQRSKRRDFANHLCSNNVIAVLAPTSTIGLAAAAWFSLRVHDAFEASRAARMTVLELWRALGSGTTSSIGGEGGGQLSTASCFSLVFGLYGRVDQQIS